MILGIDPGITGALALIDHDGELIDALPFPTLDFGHTRKAKSIDVLACLEWLEGVPIEKAGIERVGARPGQGLSSAFSFGRSLGLAEGVLQARSIDYAFVEPRVWKGRFCSFGADKDSARQEALARWDLPILAKKGKGQAVADAAFIALYVKEVLL